MAIYNYHGIEKSGKEVKSTISAESESLAKQKLKASGVMLLSIKVQSSGGPEKSPLASLGGNKINIDELSMMTMQLSTLLSAKIQLVEALNALIDQTVNSKLKIILSEVRTKVNEGSSLANALALYPKVFNNVFVNMVEAGEASGTLSIVLVRLAEFTEAQVKLKNKVRGAMMYPMIMSLIGSIMIMIIFGLVIPKITKIFISMKKKLPIMTEISIFISDIVRNYWWLIGAIAIVGYILFMKYIATAQGKSVWHRVLIKLPYIGPVHIMINVSRFSSTLATLLNSGVPILAALKIVKNLLTNVHMQAAVENSRESVSEGGSIAAPLAKSGLFPVMVTHMIALGERSGEVEPMLEIISGHYEDQVETKLSGLTSVLEPIIIVAMGLVVAFVVFSVVVPLMDMSSIKR